MKGKFSTLAIVLVACMNVLTFIYVTQTTGQLNSLTDSVNNKTNKIVYVQGKDGKTPIKGIDYFDGANGINAVSYSITNTVIKEIPIIGPIGPAGRDGVNGTDGKDAPTQEIRINPDTGDLETKQSDWSFWNILIPCAQLQVSCPGGQ